MACEIAVNRGDLDDAAAQRPGWPARSSRWRAVALVRARVHHALGDREAALALLDAERTAARTPGRAMWKLAEILGLVVDIQLELDRREATAALAEAEALATGTGWLECRMPRCGSERLSTATSAWPAPTATKPRPSRGKSSRARAARARRAGRRSAANLAAAYRAFDSCGAAPWRRRAAAELRARGLTVPRRVTRASPDLTDTEMQLVRLVREGYSNRQIAAAMHYSRKTIEVYLSRVYAKTGCPSAST